jgi:hypothetical protein
VADSQKIETQKMLLRQAITALEQALRASREHLHRLEAGECDANRLFDRLLFKTDRVTNS